MMPNTGSGVCLRKAWSARPSGVFSLWAIAWTGVGCSGAAGVGAKRTLSLYPRTAGDRQLQIPSHGHESPLAAHFFEPTQGKLTESEHGFDDAEHGFRRLFAQGVERAAFRRLQFMGHRLDRRRLFRGCRRRREAHAQLISANRGRPAASDSKPWSRESTRRALFRAHAGKIDGIRARI